MAMVAGSLEAVRLPETHQVSVDMKEGLDTCVGLRSVMEGLVKKQELTAAKFQERKAKISALKKQLQASELERDDMKRKNEEYKQAYQTVRSAQKKAKEDMDQHQSELSELRTCHSDLESTREDLRLQRKQQKGRARKILEAILSALDMAWMSIHFQAWQEDRAGAAQTKEAKAKQSTSEAALKDFMAKQKDVARGVLQRMIGNQQHELLDMAWGTWLRAVEEAKRAKEEEVQIAQAEARLRSSSEKKQEEARRVVQRMLGEQESGSVRGAFGAWCLLHSQEKLARDADRKLREAEDQMVERQKTKLKQASHVLASVVTGSDWGLASIVVRCWKEHLRDAKAAGETEAELKKATESMLRSMQDKKSLAKTMLARNLAIGDEAQLSSAVAAWHTVVQDEKKEKELQRQADARIRAYRQKKRGEAMALVERMVGAKGVALLEQCIATWGKGVMEVKRRKEIEAELVAAAEAEIKDLHDRIAKAKDELEDAEEELTENRTKNQKLKKEFQRLHEMERTLQANFEDILKA